MPINSSLVAVSQTKKETIKVVTVLKYQTKTYWSGASAPCLWWWRYTAGGGIAETQCHTWFCWSCNGSSTFAVDCSRASCSLMASPRPWSVNLVDNNCLQFQQVSTSLAKYLNSKSAAPSGSYVEALPHHSLLTSRADEEALLLVGVVNYLACPCVHTLVQSLHEFGQLAIHCANRLGETLEEGRRRHWP